MKNTTTGATSADRRAHIETVLAHYPDVTEDELQVLVRWFKHEASALDAGVVSSNPDLHRQYAQFRSEHLDKLMAKDFAVIAGVIAAMGALLAYAVVTFA